MHPERQKAILDVFDIVKKHDLVDEVWFVTTLNKVSRRLVQLGAMSDVADQATLNPGLIRRCMEEAIEEYVRMHLDRRMRN